MAVVRRLLDALAIQPGESVLEVGCGSGVIMRELARRTSRANRLIGRDMNPYLLREALALARRAGLADDIDFGEGRGEALPLPDAPSTWHCPRPCSRRATPIGCWRRLCG
jgi:ubiquinone/menaquinone biosynthesis C-methylase UbiE